MKRKIIHLYSVGNWASASVAVFGKNFIKIWSLCLLSFFLSACGGKTVSSEMGTAATESSQTFSEDGNRNTVNEQLDNRETIDASEYIAENNTVEFEEAEMILTEIPEENVGIVNMSNNICNIEKCDVHAIKADETILSKFEFISPDSVVYGDTQDVVRVKMGNYIVGDVVNETTGLLWWGDNSDVVDCNSLVLYSCNVKGRTEWLRDNNGNLIPDDDGKAIPYLADENGELLHPIGESDRVFDSLLIRAFEPCVLRILPF